MIKSNDLRITDSDLLEKLLEVAHSGIFINGPYNKLFETLWADVCKAQYCVPVSSGSAALKVALKFFKKKDQPNYCILPSYSFAATLFSVLETDYIPIFCGVESNGTLDQEQLLKILATHKVSAILPVHLYGQKINLDVDGIRRLTDAAIIEDSCQAHGSELQGDAACFSFYPSKNLGTVGDGGALVTNNVNLYQFARQYINYGDRPGKKYSHVIHGDNLRLDEIKAAILCKKLEIGQLIQHNWARLSNAGHYHSHGVHSFAQTGLTNNINVYHLYPVLFKDRERAFQVFEKNEIEVGNHYPYTLYSLAPKSLFPFQEKDKAAYIADHVVTLPISGHLSPADLQKVVSVVSKNFGWEKGMFI